MVHRALSDSLSLERIVSTLLRRVKFDKIKPLRVNFFRNPWKVVDKLVNKLAFWVLFSQKSDFFPIYLLITHMLLHHDRGAEIRRTSGFKRIFLSGSPFLLLHLMKWSDSFSKCQIHCRKWLLNLPFPALLDSVGKVLKSLSVDDFLFTFGGLLSALSAAHWVTVSHIMKLDGLVCN